jgi:hypothetical protein
MEKEFDEILAPRRVRNRFFDVITPTLACLPSALAVKQSTILIYIKSLISFSTPS